MKKQRSERWRTKKMYYICKNNRCRYIYFVTSTPTYYNTNYFNLKIHERDNSRYWWNGLHRFTHNS